ncbi:hypothetical protein OSB04_un000352 [Centaurea solstitialis]|uniref:Reverse transcriptase zinc-binding domain-containing protein n=1 Tax=Centaurea solstitialis TaxID=347529 RepID=A0AA38SHL1_9ASTR|nr:hypothetical protein OSB04_un000352 [Centaurea solstitialis]
MTKIIGELGLDDRGNDDFTVQRAYSSFRGHQQRLPWARKVWFKGHIPKHAFCMWLVCLCRLPTQDRLVEWKHDPPDYRCSLCNQCMDSHTHLFFDCHFAKEVWNWVKMRLNWMDAPDTWDMMLDYLSTPVVSSLTKLLALSATVYMIWNERNRRLFKGEKLPSIQIMKNVLEVVQNRIAWKRRKQRNTIHDVETKSEVTMSQETDPSENQSMGSHGPSRSRSVASRSQTMDRERDLHSDSDADSHPVPVRPASPARPFGPETHYGLRGRRTARKSVPLPTRMTFRIPTGDGAGPSRVRGQGGSSSSSSSSSSGSPPPYRPSSPIARVARPPPDARPPPVARPPPIAPIPSVTPR